MKRRAIPGSRRNVTARGEMFGAKSESTKMLARKGSLSKDNPPGFNMNLKQAAGKGASGATRAKTKKSPNVAKKPRAVPKARTPEKPAKIKVKKPG